MSVRRGCAAVLCWMAIAATAAPLDTERDRITAERAAAMAEFAARERACQAQFVVIACVDAALKEQRAALARLHQRQAMLDDSRRRASAAARTQAIQAKAAVQQARASDAVGVAPQQTTRHVPMPHAPGAARSGDERRSRAGAPRIPSAEQLSTEQRNEARFEAGARAAQAHRDAVQRRNAQRAAQGKVPSPLPLPPAASPP